MKPRHVIAFLLIAATAAGVGTVARADGGPSPGVSYGWSGVVGPRGEVRYVALPAAPNTAVAAVRVRGGTILRFRSLRGDYGVPRVAWDGTAGGVTRDGKTLVLASAPASVSRFAVLDTRTLRPRQVVTLRGSFSFDALSPDGKTLYLIQYVSKLDSSLYRVRAFDLAGGRLLRRVIVDRREGEGVMSGSPLRRVESADGRWAYTLYRHDGHRPFIHALDTVHRQAVCIDLPWRGSQDPLWRMRLALSPDGAQLVLRNRAGAPVVVVDTRTHRVMRR